jgi:hypothetical protein
MMLDIMEEIDGTLGRGLERAFVVAFGRVLRDNPFFQKYEWWIVGCVIGLPIIVSLLSGYFSEESRNLLRISMMLRFFPGTI